MQLDQRYMYRGLGLRAFIVIFSHFLARARLPLLDSKEPTSNFSSPRCTLLHRCVVNFSKNCPGSLYISLEALIADNVCGGVGCFICLFARKQEPVAWEFIDPLDVARRSKSDRFGNLALLEAENSDQGP